MECLMQARGVLLALQKKMTNTNLTDTAVSLDAAF